MAKSGWGMVLRARSRIGPHSPCSSRRSSTDSIGIPSRASSRIFPQSNVFLAALVNRLNRLWLASKLAARASIVCADGGSRTHTFIEALPQGYDTDVAKRGGRLSAGQRQLVAFARAFLADPDVLILDEATSSLDIPSERLVQHALQTVLAGRTALIIAHRLSTVEIADRVLVLEHGRVLEDGSPQELMRQTGGKYAALHQAWVDSLA